jgi:hypothetical protein
LDSAEVFAKVLAENDDSGRHGVLIPKASYTFFPDLPIVNANENATVLFSAHARGLNQDVNLAWKYYQRYPERRVTRLDPVLNERAYGRRLLVMVRIPTASGQTSYLVDASVEGLHPHFHNLVEMLFPDSVNPIPGAFVAFPLDSVGFRVDADLAELLERFDRISAMGWVDSLRQGDTGIGYTFETLAGIEENNDPGADFRGIEIKCKLTSEAVSPAGKINLFQHGPDWLVPGNGRDRLRLLGTPNERGLLTCHSQVTTTPNNKELWLSPAESEIAIHLRKSHYVIGEWAHQRLGERLQEKHARAVFVRAARRLIRGRTQYHYRDLLYCERPDIDRFLSLVSSRRIVFEFAMSEQSDGQVRNHGYPWRLVDERDLEQLFAMQVPLRTLD